MALFLVLGGLHLGGAVARNGFPANYGFALLNQKIPMCQEIVSQKRRDIQCDALKFKLKVLLFEMNKARRILL